MKKIRRVLSLTLMLALCLALMTACGNNNGTATTSSNPSDNPSSSPDSSPGGSQSSNPDSFFNLVVKDPPDPGAQLADNVTVLISDSIAVMNVHAIAGTGAFTSNAHMMVYDCLAFMLLDGTGLFIPMLAKSWETDDFQTWIFHLRDDVYFHNGDKMTAKDVVYTVNLGKEQIGTPAYENWTYADTIEALDDYTVKITLLSPYPDYLYHVAPAMCQILNQRAIEEDPEKGYWVGTGPYKVAEFSSNDYIVFERFDDYYGEKPYTKTVTFKYVPEPSSRTIMMENGQATVARGVPITDYPIFENDPDYKLISTVTNNLTSILFNMDDPITGDWNFRMAVASAIDRTELTALSADNAIPIPEELGSVWGRTTNYRNTDIHAVPYDLDKAKEYLAASPYDGTPVELAYQFTVGRAGEAIQQQLAKIGLEIVLNPMDMPSIGAYTIWSDNKSQMVFYDILLNLNASSGYQNNFRPGSNNNRMRYDNPELTEMINAAPGIIGEAEREAHFTKMQEIIAKDIPCIPVYWQEKVAIGVKGAGGITVGSTFEDYRYLYEVIG